MNTLELYIQRNFNIKNVVKGDDFQYDENDDTLMYRVNCDEIQDRAFNEDIEATFGYKVNCPFALSILHEIGHSVTLPRISDKQKEEIMAEKEKIEEAIEALDDDNIDGYVAILKTEYFKLPDEVAATFWAVYFANEHPRVVEILEKLGEWARNEEDK